MGLSGYLKSVPFTLKIRQSRVRGGDQSSACVATVGYVDENENVEAFLKTTSIPSANDEFVARR
jgi:hypothetical protein